MYGGGTDITFEGNHYLIDAVLLLWSVYFQRSVPDGVDDRLDIL